MEKNLRRTQGTHVKKIPPHDGPWWEQPSLHLNQKPWKTIQKRYPSAILLTSALQLIGSQKSIFLDLKDYAITLPHLLTAVGKTTLKALYIAAGDPFYFKQWQKNWPKSWVRVANRTWQPFPSPKPYRDAHVDIVELMGWNARPATIERFQKSGLGIGLTSFLCPRRFYERLCAQNIKPPLHWLLFRHF